MIIGTAMLIRVDNQLCQRSRNHYGKVEEDETFRQAAVRECLEETGLEVFRVKLVFHGFTTYQGKGYCYCYEANDLRQLKEMIGMNHGSVVQPYKDFLSSKYNAYCVSNLRNDSMKYLHIEIINSMSILTMLKEME